MSMPAVMFIGGIILIVFGNESAKAIGGFIIVLAILGGIYSGIMS